MLLSLALLLVQDAPDPAAVSPARLRESLRVLCAEPRLAGSAEARAAADHCAEVFRRAGLEVQRPRYLVYLPRQTGQSLALLGADGERQELGLREQGHADDPLSTRAHVPPMHGLTHAGRAAGPVVFAGRGTASEFAALREELGAQLDGSIALVRYGGLYRGLKVHNAAQAGCAGALLYTDPEDDGHAKGAVLPEGPWRPAHGIQRGSVYNRDGDPLTPGRPAKARAERLDPAQVEGLVAIPSLPISWANAALLFGAAGRPEAPALLGTRVELEVRQDPALVWIENVIGVLRGASSPDEWVVVGAHRDAWGYGAVDNGSGTAVTLELARVLGAATKAGWRPERSIALATWDAEEWGLVGSTEWVEEYREALRAGGIAYLNMDSVASGPGFSASCTPGLARVLEEACAAEQVNPPADLGTPGGGSDHVPFLELAGMEVLNFGFHGGHGSYHSALDTPWIVEHHLDPDFRWHAAAARLALRMTTALAGGSTPVDGLAGWAQRAARAASALELPPAQRQRLDQAAAALQAALAAPGPHPAAHAFLRPFLPEEAGESCLLWRTNGYGADWFPEVVQALAAGKDSAPAVDRAAAAMERAAARFAAPGAAVGR